MKYLLTLTLLSIFLFSIGQERINGRVLNEVTNEPLDLAHVGILGSTVGTVSNSNGEFSLVVPEALISGSLAVYYVGFETIQIRVADLDEVQDFKLKPSAIRLPVLTVSDKKRSIIDEAIKLLPDNHDQGDTRLTGFWRAQMKDQERFIQVSETAFDAFRRDGKDALKINKGRALRDTTSFERFKMFNAGISPKSLFAGSFLADMSIISKKTRRNTDYEIVDVTSFNERPVYVIDFEKKSKYNGVGYAGTILLDTETLAFVKLNFSFSEKNTEPVELFKNWLLKRITGLGKSTWTRYDAEFHYKPVNDKWYFSHANFNIVWTLIDNDETFEIPITYHGDLVATEISKDVSQYPDKEEKAGKGILVGQSVSDKGDFWEDFTVMLGDHDFDQIFNQIEARNKQRN